MLQGRAAGSEFVVDKMRVLPYIILSNLTVTINRSL